MSEPISIALVTGGNRGIGLAIATSLKAAGHRVVITYRTGNPPVGFEAVQMDVTDSASVDSAFSKIEEARGVAPPTSSGKIFSSSAGSTRPVSCRST